MTGPEAIKVNNTKLSLSRVRFDVLLMRIVRTFQAIRRAEVLKKEAQDLANLGSKEGDAKVLQKKLNDFMEVVSRSVISSSVKVRTQKLFPTRVPKSCSLILTESSFRMT